MGRIDLPCSVYVWESSSTRVSFLAAARMTMAHIMVITVAVYHLGLVWTKALGHANMFSLIFLAAI